MLGAGLIAQKAVAKGLKVAPYIKTSLSPGSGVVSYYLEESGVVEALDALGFTNVGYGCMTCIGKFEEYFYTLIFFLPSILSIYKTQILFEKYFSFWLKVHL